MRKLRNLITLSWKMRLRKSSPTRNCNLMRSWRHQSQTKLLSLSLPFEHAVLVLLPNACAHTAQTLTTPSLLEFGKRHAQLLLLLHSLSPSPSTESNTVMVEQAGIIQPQNPLQKHIENGQGDELGVCWVSEQDSKKRISWVMGITNYRFLVRWCRNWRQKHLFNLKWRNTASLHWQVVKKSTETYLRNFRTESL